MCAKTLRKQFPSLQVFPASRFKSNICDSMRISGFKAYRQREKVVEAFRVVLRNKYYVYVVPENEFNMRMKATIA